MVESLSLLFKIYLKSPVYDSRDIWSLMEEGNAQEKEDMCENSKKDWYTLQEKIKEQLLIAHTKDYVSL